MIKFDWSDGRQTWHVSGDWLPPVFGARDSLGVPESPDEPACFEIDEVKNGDGEHVDLDAFTADQIADICEAGLRHAEEEMAEDVRPYDDKDFESGLEHDDSSYGPGGYKF